MEDSHKPGSLFYVSIFLYFVLTDRLLGGSRKPYISARKVIGNFVPEISELTSLFDTMRIFTLGSQP